MGFKEGYHVVTPDGGQITIMNSDSGASVELIENKNYDVGMYSVGTDVDNLEEVLEHLTENGYEAASPVIPTSVGKQAFVMDPNGVRSVSYTHLAVARLHCSTVFPALFLMIAVRLD